jgi:putative nucleotidyltransferase with HDIG domain
LTPKSQGRPARDDGSPGDIVRALFAATKTAAGLIMNDTLWLGDSASAEAQKKAASSAAGFLASSLGAGAMRSSAQRVVAITDNPAYRTQDVVAVLEADPAMSARVLQLVNSAGYGLRTRCTSVSHAVTLLGNLRLRQMATVAGVLRLFESASAETQRVCEHSIIVGALARHLAPSCNLPAEEMFTCGALHDLGKLMLLEADEKRYREVLADDAMHGDLSHELELDAFGFDHAILGGYVLHAWKIPSPVPHVIAFHHRPWLAGRVSDRVASMVHVVRLADRLAYELLEAGTPAAELIEALGRDEATRHLRLGAGFFERELPGLSDLATRTRASLAAGRAAEGSVAPRSSRGVGGKCSHCDETESTTECPRCRSALCVAHGAAEGACCDRCEDDFRERRRVDRRARLLGQASALTAVAAVGPLGSIALPGLLAPAYAGAAHIAAVALSVVVFALAGLFLHRRRALRDRFLVERTARSRSAAAAPQPVVAPPSAPARGPAAVSEVRRKPLPPMLEITPDPRTGAGSIEVRRGRFRGRRVDAMLYADVLLLLDECRRTEPASATLLQIHIDEVRARERQARPERPASGPGPASAPRKDEMSRVEAAQILGLQPACGPREVKDAHKRLMLKIHPDQGGSNYLAVKINQARDLLLTS